MITVRGPLIGAAILFTLVLALGLAVNAGWAAGADNAVGSALALQAGHGQDGLISFWWWISWSGGGGQRYVIVAVLALLLGFWHRWHSGVILAAMAVLSNSAAGYLKEAFGRPRPDLVSHLDPVYNLSYPSGHATSAALVYLLFALLVPTARRTPWVGAAALIAFLTGFSRLTLGVHWSTDLIGGWMLGGAFALVGLVIARRFNPS